MTIKSYSLTIDLDEEYNQKDFYECIENITNHLKILVSLSKIVNKCEKALESDATIKKNILDEIERQLNNVNLFKQRIKKAKKYKTLN